MTAPAPPERPMKEGEIGCAQCGKVGPAAEIVEHLRVEHSIEPPPGFQPPKK